MAHVVRVGGRRIEVTSLDRVIFPEPGLTKGDIIEYYRRAAKWMAPHTRDRPANLQRFPEGIAGSGFFQQGMPDHFPEWIRSVTVAKEGGEVRHVILQDAATLVYVANQGMLTPHVWPSRADRLDRPDRMIFDLDPPGDAPAEVRRAALAVRELLDELELPNFVMTSGSRGYHVVVPLSRRADYDTVRTFARDAATLLASRHPDLLTTEVRKENRKGRILVDILRNAYAHTAVPPYAVRARPEAPVATPIDWDELDEKGMHPRRFTVITVLDRLEKHGDPWRSIGRSAVSLGAARRKLDALNGRREAVRMPLPRDASTSRKAAGPNAGSKPSMRGSLGRMGRKGPPR
ncbi:MAG: non-homologous end-joining DNA ligase [Actinomycetota bacterium]|nr:non-homologous end-joining DNA ligase [Actinomycetota bacterium]